MTSSSVRRRPWAAFVGILLVVVTVLASASIGAEPEPAKRIVRVGVYQNRPKVFMGDDGKAGGLFIELLVEIARAEGWTLSFVPCEWAECLAALDQGRIDVMPDVAYSRERDERYDFHRTQVIESWSQMYAPPGAGIQRLTDLRGKRVALLQDSVQQAGFEEMMGGFGLQVTVLPEASLEEVFAAARDGDADVAIANHLFGDYYHREYRLERTPVVFMAAQLHYATAQGRNPDLLLAVDRHLEAWRKEPNSTYYATLGRWMDRPPVGILPDRVFWIMGMTAGLLLLAVGFILVLRGQVRQSTQHLRTANEDLRRVEAALRKSESLLNAAERLGKVGGWEWDIEKEQVTGTKEAYRICGWGRSESPEGRARVAEVLARFEPEAQAAVQEAFDRCRDHGTPFDLEGQFQSASGEFLWVRITAEAVRGGDGKVVKVVGNLMDVTERKKADQAHRSVEEQLRQSQKMEAIGKLAGGVAHDFNNLLTVILGYSELASRHLQEGHPAHKPLAEVLNASKRAAGLTRQLLVFSRSQVIERKHVDINQVVNSIDGLLRRAVGEGIDLRMALAPDLGVTLADAGQVEQVLMNLVVNARDAMPQGGTLTLETANVDLDEAYVAKHVDVVPGPYVLLSVTDTGCGMDTQTQSRIFEPFFTTKERGKGTGLGLATVYGIVSQSGGHVAVESQPGRGSTFEIYLPRESPTVSIPPASTQPSARVDGTETILIVEDDGAVRELEAQILRSAGYTVLVAETEGEALRVSDAHEGTIHLLLTSAITPGGGEDFIDRLHSVRPGVRILALSGSFDSEVARSARGPQVRFLSKPITIESLTRKVRETLDGV
jgi:PAS domain S-box-containing protein